MKKSLLLWQVGALTFVSVLGTLLHFVYDWTNLAIFKPISAVNESTFEHMKILFFPMLIFAFIQYFYFKDYKSYWQIKTLGIIIGIMLIPILFYTLNGAFGKTPDWVNIAIFFISGGISYLVEGILIKNNVQIGINKYIFVAILVLITVGFVAFTYNPPCLPIFIDPTWKKYYYFLNITCI